MTYTGATSRKPITFNKVAQDPAFLASKAEEHHQTKIQENNRDRWFSADDATFASAYHHLSIADKKDYAKAQKNYKRLSTHEKVQYDKDWKNAHRATAVAKKSPSPANHKVAAQAHHRASKSALTRVGKMFHIDMRDRHAKKLTRGTSFAAESEGFKWSKDPKYSTHHTVTSHGQYDISPPLGFDRDYRELSYNSHKKPSAMGTVIHRFSNTRVEFNKAKSVAEQHHRKISGGGTFAAGYANKRDQFIDQGTNERDAEVHAKTLAAQSKQAAQYTAGTSEPPSILRVSHGHYTSRKLPSGKYSLHYTSKGTHIDEALGTHGSFKDVAATAKDHHKQIRDATQIKNGTMPFSAALAMNFAAAH